MTSQMTNDISDLGMINNEADSSQAHAHEGAGQSLNSHILMDHNYTNELEDFLFEYDVRKNLPTTSGCQVPAADTQTFKFDADKICILPKIQARKERQTQSEIRRLRLKTKSFKQRVQQIEKVSLKRHLKKLTKYISEPCQLFTEMQCREGQKKKNGRRFNLKEKVLSLSLFRKSPKCYKLMCKYFAFPSIKTLKSLLSDVKINPGINELIFKGLKNTVSKIRLENNRLCTLIFDEMSVAPNIQYNSYTDELVGFENYGTQKTGRIANHVLVFMVRGVKKNFKQPVAYYFTQTLKAAKLKEILVEVIRKVQVTGLKIIATVCDQSLANVNAINSLISEAKTAYFHKGQEWRYDLINVNDDDIIPLFDVPHLLKGVRNNILNKEMQYLHDDKIKVVKWEYIQQVYQANRSDGELSIVQKLTEEHINPSKIEKMKVKNAAQVFSYDVAVTTYNLLARGVISGECHDLVPFLLLMDKLFDSLNSSTFTPLDGKIYRSAVKSNSPHHELWQEAITLFKSIKFIIRNPNGENCVKYVPTIKNFIRTIEGFKILWQLLSKKFSFDAMLTRNFNQDPLENFFGSIRSLIARNVTPNCVAFEGAFRTLLLNNYTTNHSINANCEEDTAKFLQPLSFLIESCKNKEKRAPTSLCKDIVIDQPLNVLQKKRNIFDSVADQRIYVCGWALKKTLQKIVKSCKKCRNKLLSKADDEMYKYIHNSEFHPNKRWLCYPSECLVAYFMGIQETTISFLQEECYKTKIKERIIAYIDLFVDCSFLECKLHEENFKRYFVDTSINIIIYSWCRSINRILEGKIKYEGEDPTKKAAQAYYNKYSFTHK